MRDKIEKERTLHTHLYIQFKNPIYFSAIKSMFKIAHHIEEAGEIAKDNRVYIPKEGKLCIGKSIFNMRLESIIRFTKNSFRRLRLMYADTHFAVIWQKQE